MSRTEHDVATADLRIGRIQASVRQTLAARPPDGYAAIPAGTALLGARIAGKRLTLNFNRALIANGLGARLEDALRQIVNPLPMLLPDIAAIDFRFEIDGVPLENLR